MANGGTTTTDDDAQKLSIEATITSLSLGPYETGRTAEPTARASPRRRRPRAAKVHS